MAMTQPGNTEKYGGLGSSFLAGPLENTSFRQRTLLEGCRESVGWIFHYHSVPAVSSSSDLFSLSSLSQGTCEADQSFIGCPLSEVNLWLASRNPSDDRSLMASVCMTREAMQQKMIPNTLSLVLFLTSPLTSQGPVVNSNGAVGPFHSKQVWNLWTLFCLLFPEDHTAINCFLSKAVVFYHPGFLPYPEKNSCHSLVICFVGFLRKQCRHPCFKK